MLPQSVRLFCLLPLCLIIAACTETSDTQVLRVGHNLDTRHSVHQALQFMGERLEQYSNGTMQLKIYASGQLGNEREMLELLQIGSLAMTKVSAATLESFVPEMQLFGLPYVFQSYQHRWAVLDSDIGSHVLSTMNKAHLQGLAFMDAGSRSFYSCHGAINSPDDLKGKKIRVMNSPSAVKLVNALGGAATPLSWAELYGALQQGVVDGAENNPPSFYSSGHYELCKDFNLNEHTAIPDVIIASAHIIKQLSSDQQTWLAQAATDAAKEQRRLWREAELQALNNVKSHGVRVTHVDKAPFIDKVAHLHQAFDGSDIGDLLKQIKALAVAESEVQ
ncbi:TRAP transporter substrate-binding protein [Thalassotalea marina]|uniref:C4-dicarboxylate ABC transporter substrate-binding protein n=1 Tax=Thalassotalea marina TaxID=1673741 RepID=A0A919BMC4_9GAMM|nr:TRAP transporter substrate-binding protein [Thalassotalea marina]GHF97307.1 C4-dicarboxylate ABC transporter substrate-binding protein [Thalassotalea marina]